jgi:hypothetical protein
MFTLPGLPGVYEEHQTYHHTTDFEPVPEGVQMCRVSVHPSPIDDRPVLADVAPGRPLPPGWRWATPAEIAALTGSHPDWKDPR